MTPLSRYGKSCTPPKVPVTPARIYTGDLAFFEQLGDTLALNGAPAAGLLGMLSNIGLSVDHGFDPSALSAGQKKALAQAIKDGEPMLDAASAALGSSANGWQYAPVLPKYFGTDYMTRAAIGYGDRPTQADFGFMGPMFRHFFCDPDPARVMRDTAPGVQEWVARMWNMKPQRFSSASQIEMIPDDLSALLEPVVSVYLPYLLANEAAVLAGREQVSYEALGAGWLEPAKPYRLWCLDQLRGKYRALNETACTLVNAALGDVTATNILATVPTGHCDHLVATLPCSGTCERPVFDSWGREAEGGP